MSSDFIGAHALRRLTRRRFWVAVLCALVATIVIALVCPLIGVDMSRHLELLDLGSVWSGLTGEPTQASTIFALSRLPRTLAALLIGAGLSAAGCAFQALLRNPLAEPYTLGISSGSALAAVLAIRFGLDGVAGGSGVGLAALAGAAVTVYVVWRLGRVGRSLPAATLLLAGITIAMFCAAAIMVVQYTSDLYEINRIIRWMMGGLDWVRYDELLRSGALIGASLVALLWLARDFNALSAGADAAASVGIDANRSKTIAFAIGSVIVGAAIALAGPIGFVGLIVPHAMRGVVGPDHRILLPVSILAGGALLVVCDTIARIVIFPAQLPVGVVTALIGGPFFLYLLVREKSIGRLWGG